MANFAFSLQFKFCFLDTIGQLRCPIGSFPFLQKRIVAKKNEMSRRNRMDFLAHRNKANFNFKSHLLKSKKPKQTG